MMYTLQKYTFHLEEKTHLLKLRNIVRDGTGHT